MKTLKDEMMKLWKATFGDSDEYVRLVLDTYFVEENVESVAGREGDIVSSLLAVPYRFLERSADSYFEHGLNFRKGIYLCGLATIPEERGRGVMTNLMKRIEDRAADLGYDFSFLIPADDGLRDYYSRHGYISLSGKYEYCVDYSGDTIDCSGVGQLKYQRGVVQSDVEIVNTEFDICLKDIGEVCVRELNVTEREFEQMVERFTAVSVSEFDCSGTNVEKGCETIFEDAEKANLFLNCYQYMVEEESRRDSVSIMHCWRDFIAAVREINISEGKVLVLQASDCKPFALLFCYNSREAKSIDIRFSAAQTEDCLALLLLYLKLCCFQDAERAILTVAARHGGKPARSVVDRLLDASLVYRSSGDQRKELSLHLVSSDPEYVAYGMMKRLKASSVSDSLCDYREEVAICNSQRVEDSEDSCVMSDFGIGSVDCDYNNRKYGLNDNKKRKKCKFENDAVFDSESCKCNSKPVSGSSESLLESEKRDKPMDEPDRNRNYPIADRRSVNSYPESTESGCLNICLMLD